MYNKDEPDLTLLYLNYQGWAIVLELLSGVIGVISLAGMILSGILKPEQVEGYQKQD